MSVCRAKGEREDRTMEENRASSIGAPAAGFGGAALGTAAAPAAGLPFGQPTAPFLAPPRQRRVGTFTLGVTLILIGILIPIGLLYGEAVWQVLMFGPALLVLLGGEVLYYALRYRSDKLRYDGVSVFLVILITLVTIAGSVTIPPVARAMGYYQEKEEAIETMYRNAQEAVAECGYHGDVSVNDDRYSTRREFWQAVGKGHLQEDWKASLYIGLNDIGTAHPTREEAASAVEQVIRSLDAAQIYRVEFCILGELPDGEYGTLYSVFLYGDMLQEDAAGIEEILETWN